MPSLLKVAKATADIVLGLRNFKKFQVASMKANKETSEVKDSLKEVRFQLDSLSSLFGGFGGPHQTPKGAAVHDALRSIREADDLIDQAKRKLYEAQDRMREIDWEKM